MAETFQYDSSDSNRSNDKFEVVIDDPVENEDIQQEKVLKQL